MLTDLVFDHLNHSEVKTLPVKYVFFLNNPTKFTALKY